MAKLNGKDIIGIITKGRLVKLQKKTITPTASAQTIKPDTGYDGLSEVTINKYVSKSQTKTVTPKINDQTITPDAGYDGLSSVVVKKAPITSRKTITPKTTSQTINPNDGDIGLEGVVVNGDSNLVAGNIKKNVSIFGITGSLEAGMASFKQYLEKSFVEIKEDDFGSVTSLQDDLFKDFKNLTTVKIPDTITSIGTSAFKNCTKLSEIVLPNGITAIPFDLFYGCKSIKNIELPDSIETIGEYAFHGCSSLEQILLPDDVTAIGMLAFYNCTNLKNVNIPSGLTEISMSMFYNCKSLSSIIIPRNITVIDHMAFSGCSGLTSIVIPNSVISLGDDYAEEHFYGCTGLTEVTFEENCKITSFPKSMFWKCSSLTSMTIPSSVTKLGVRSLAIGSSTNKATLTFLSATPPSFIVEDTDNTPFGWMPIGQPQYSQSNISKIIVPKGCGDTYKAAPGWSTYVRDIIVEATE